MRPGDVRCGQVTLHLEDHMLVEKEADTREVEVEARREVEASLTTPQPLTREDNICKVSKVSTAHRAGVPSTQEVTKPRSPAP